MKKAKPHDYKLILRDISEGEQVGFEVHVPALNAFCFGDGIQSALNSYYVYFEDELLRRNKEGIEMPKSDAKPQKLKQVPLRLPEDVYQQAVNTAKTRGLSFNAMVTGMLSGI